MAEGQRDSNGTDLPNRLVRRKSLYLSWKAPRSPNRIHSPVFPSNSTGAKKKDTTIETNGEPVQEEEDQDKEETEKLRVEGVVDEYATLVQIDDHMKKLDAVVVENNKDSTEGKSM